MPDYWVAGLLRCCFTVSLVYGVAMVHCYWVTLLPCHQVKYMSAGNWPEGGVARWREGAIWLAISPARMASSRIRPGPPTLGEWWPRCWKAKLLKIHRFLKVSDSPRGPAGPHRKVYFAKFVPAPRAGTRFREPVHDEKTRFCYFYQRFLTKTQI